jgi:Family of unknown function (DUF6932)
MTIPACDARGFLLEGVYDATLEEILDRFGQFRSNDHRVKLGERLAGYVASAASTGLLEEIYVDGSFVSDKETPSDIDLILTLKRGHDFTATLSPFDYGVLSSRRVKARFKFDVAVFPHGSLALEGYVNFFQDVKGMPGERKGILRLRL